MATSSSGRVVIIIDPVLKKDLRRALLTNDLTMKDWFIQNATRSIDESRQPSLFSNRPAGGSGDRKRG